MQNILIGHLTCLDHLCEHNFSHTNRKFTFDRFLRIYENMQIMVTCAKTWFATSVIRLQLNSVFSCTVAVGVWLKFRVHQFFHLLPLGRLIGIICFCSVLFYRHLHNLAQNQNLQEWFENVFSKYEILGCPWVDTFQSSGLKLKNEYLLSVLFVCVKMLLRCMQNTADNAVLQAAQCCILWCSI